MNFIGDAKSHVFLGSTEITTVSGEACCEKEWIIVIVKVMFLKHLPAITCV